MFKNIFIFRIFFLIIQNVHSNQKYYIATSPNSPYSECVIDLNGTNFSGLDIEYSKKLMKELEFQNGPIDWEFKCINFSRIKYYPEINDTLFYIGGITKANSRNYLSEGMTLSYPFIISGMSILMLKQTEFWIFFHQFSWETILLILSIIIVISISHFLFEKRCFALEDYFWNSFCALFLINDLKLAKTSSKIMMFALWLMSFVIWTMSFAGIFSIIYNGNSIFQIHSANDLNDKLILSEPDYFGNLRMYGAKTKSFSFNNTNLIPNVLKSKYMNPSDGIKIDALVVEDPVANYFVNLDNNFLKVDAKFIPISFYLLFKKNQIFQEEINKVIIKFQEEMITYETFQNNSNSSNDINKIPIYFIEELLIILGISLLICSIFNIISRLIFNKIKMTQYLMKKKILNPDNFKKKELSFRNAEQIIFAFEMFKEIIDEEANKISTEITLRLEIMKDKINRFYDSLLVFRNENKKLSTLGFAEKINRKSKRIAVPSHITMTKKEFNISNIKKI